MAHAPLHVSFVAGEFGEWRIDGTRGVVGASLPPAERLQMVEGTSPPMPGVSWTLSGVVSHLRYTTHNEVARLTVAQEGLGRPGASCAALVPIRKSAAWWALAQDERRAIFEEQSHHIAIGEQYLPRIARRLHHSRDLGEPFDFLTWFEYAPQHAKDFDAMLVRLRATREWTFVEREVEVRLTRG